MRTPECGNNHVWVNLCCSRWRSRTSAITRRGVRHPPRGQRPGQLKMERILKSILRGNKSKLCGGCVGTLCLTMICLLYKMVDTVLTYVIPWRSYKGQVSSCIFRHVALQGFLTEKKKSLSSGVGHYVMPSRRRTVKLTSSHHLQNEGHFFFTVLAGDKRLSSVSVSACS